MLYKVRCGDKTSTSYVGRDGMAHMNKEKAPALTKAEAVAVKRIHDADSRGYLADVVEAVDET